MLNYKAYKLLTVLNLNKNLYNSTSLVIMNLLNLSYIVESITVLNLYTLMILKILSTVDIDQSWYQNLKGKRKKQI